MYDLLHTPLSVSHGICNTFVSRKPYSVSATECGHKEFESTQMAPRTTSNKLECFPRSGIKDTWNVLKLRTDTNLCLPFILALANAVLIWVLSRCPKKMESHYAADRAKHNSPLRSKDNDVDLLFLNSMKLSFRYSGSRWPSYTGESSGEAQRE